MSPNISGDHLYVYIEPTSPKGKDLHRKPRYALHSAVEDTAGGGGEYFIRGRAVPITDGDTRAEYDARARFTPK